jgi:hypothetical protein
MPRNLIEQAFDEGPKLSVSRSPTPTELISAVRWSAGRIRHSAVIRMRTSIRTTAWIYPWFTPCRSTSRFPRLCFDIHSRAIMESYFREVNRLLRLGSLFKLDVQGTTTAARTVIRRLASACARMVVPSRRRRHVENIGWFGRIVSPNEARRLADRTGFELRYNHWPGVRITGSGFSNGNR